MASVLVGRSEADEVALVASELRTNAVCHSASGESTGMFVVSVLREPDSSQVRVQDFGSRRKPAIRYASDTGPPESGRGLLLVDAIAKEWGTDRNLLGWVVWAELASAHDDCVVPGP